MPPLRRCQALRLQSRSALSAAATTPDIIIAHSHAFGQLSAAAAGNVITLGPEDAQMLRPETSYGWFALSHS